MGIVWGPNAVGYDSSNHRTNGVVAVTNSNLNAAILALGYDVLDSRLDHDAKAKLSNESTGGAFYTFAQLFNRLYNPSNGQYNYPSWGGTPGHTSSMWGAFDVWATIYGADYIYWAAYTDAQLASAKEDLDVILDGGSIGGGSGGGSGGGQSGDFPERPQVFWAGNVGKFGDRDSFYASYSSAQAGSVNSMINTFKTSYNLDDVRWVLIYPSSNSQVLAFPSSCEFEWDGERIVSLRNTANERISFLKIQVYNGSWNSDGDSTVQYVQGSVVESIGVNASASLSDVRYISDTSGSGGGSGSLPDNNWPDDPDPDYGTPPELPDPQNPIPDVEPGDPANPVTPSPPVEPGNPTSPIVPSPPQEPGNPQNPTVPTPPTLPNPTTYTGGTYTIDIQGILDAMDEHCIHLQNCITSNFGGYWSSISTLISNEFSNLKTYMQTLTESVNGMIEWLAEVIDGDFSYQNTYMNSLATAITNKLGWLGNMLHADLGYQNTYLQQVASSINDNIQWLGGLVADYFESMAEYLHDLFEWLAEQFDFSVSGGSYNDDTVVSWLKKIWSKLGSGTSSRPADPVSDPVGTGGWLDTLFNNLVTALTDLFPGLLDELLGGLGELTSKFPFSIPWDVAALLGLLVAPAECPSVEIPAYTYDGTSIVQAGSYDIDLEEYDEVWGGVRMMMKVAFVMYVLVHTKDFMAVIEKVVSPDA